MPEGPTEISPLAEELGYLLARTREERGLTKEIIAASIHMRRRYLDAIELGRFEDLPGATYARGYLKRYAEFLELNVGTILEMYDRLEHAPSRKFFILSGSLERNPYPSGRLVILTLGLALVLILLWASQHRFQPTALVEPYATFEQLTRRSTLPHRCEGEKSAYPPCYWENLGLWYHPYTPHQHIFNVRNHAAAP